MTEGVYATIYEIIRNQSFLDRYTDDISIVFRDVTGILDYKLSSDKNDDLLVHISPTFEDNTELISRFITESKNNLTILGDTNEIKVVIDISSIKDITRLVKEKMISEYSTIFSAEVELSQLGIDRQLTPDRYDAYFIQNLSPFTSTLIDNLDSMKMMNKFVYCKRGLPIAEMKSFDREDLDKTLLAIELIMSAAVKFTHVKMTRCIT
jgi:hypothetical protein